MILLNKGIRSHAIMVDKVIDPYIVLYASMGVLPLFNGGFDNDIVYYTMLFQLVILIGYFVRKKKELLLNSINESIWVVLFTIWSFMSVFWSINCVRSIIEFLQLFLYVSTFIMFQHISEQKIEQVIRITVIAATGIAAFGILEYIFVSGNRITSTFGNPNPLGIYLSMFFLFIWGTALNDKPDSALDWKKCAVSIVLIVAVFLTGSRGSYLSLMLALPLIFLNISRKNLIRSILRTIMCICIAVLFTYLIMSITPLIPKQIHDGTAYSSMSRTESFLPKSVKGRLEFWNVAVQLIKYHPINGFGLGTFSSAYYIEYSGNQWYSRYAHNQYLQTIVETGIVGISLMLAFLARSAKSIVDRYKRRSFSKYTPGAVSACFAFLIHIGMDFSWNFPAVTLLFFAFLGMSVQNEDMKETGSDTKAIGFNIPYKLSVAVLALVFIIVSAHYTSAEMLKKGISYMGKDTERAKEYIHIANGIYPINSIGQYYESKLHYDIYRGRKTPDDLETAIRIAEKAARLAPYDGSLHTHLGKLYHEAGYNSRAEENLVYGVKYSAYILSTYIDLAKFYNEEGENKKEEAVLRAALDKIEFSIDRAPEKEKPLRLIEGAVIHKMMMNIYNSRNEMVLAEYHKSEGQKLMEKAFAYIGK